MPASFTLTPAYGRDYKSAKEVRADLNAGKDFQVQPSGQYCSLRDFPAGTQLICRYRGLRQLCVVKVTEVEGKRHAAAA